MRHRHRTSTRVHGSDEKPASRATGRSAWTLSEVLVVIAIIALLLSILLPCFFRARAQAQAALCASNIANICRAENTYQTANDGWIPGSPWTTGRCFLDRQEATWNPARRFDRFAIEWMDYTTPLKALMYGRQSVPRPADKKAESAQHTRIAIIERLTRELFHCPANPHVMSWDHGEQAGPDLPAVSYMTMWTLMRAGPGMLDETLKDRAIGYRRWPGLQSVAPDPDDPGPGNERAPCYVAQAREWDVVVPDHYMPRHGWLGREQSKVFVADGLRFYDPDTGTISYTTHPRAAKGMVSASPPSTAEDGDPQDQEGREYNAARRFSYRHGHSDHINAGFFDGHVELLGVDYRRSTSQGRGFSGKATHPQWYYPSGSIVRNPTGLHRETIPPDTVLP